MHHNASVWCAILALSTKGRALGLARPVSAAEIFGVVTLDRRSIVEAIRRLRRCGALKRERIGNAWGYTIPRGAQCPTDGRGGDRRPNTTKGITP